MEDKTALLVIDMQVFFESMTSAALPNIKLLCSQFTEAKSLIIFTQHGHSEAELTTKPSPSQLVRKWGASGSIAHGSDEWQLMKDLAEYHSARSEPGSASASTSPVVVAKNAYDAFLNTELESVLQDNNISRVVVCGVMTDCCCDTTARGAFNRGFETWLVSDACGSASGTQHQRGLKAFEWAFGEVLQTKEVLKRLRYS